MQGKCLLFFHLLFSFSSFRLTSDPLTAPLFPFLPLQLVFFLSWPLIHHDFLFLPYFLSFPSDRAPVLPLSTLFLSLYYLPPVWQSTITSSTSLTALSSCFFYTAPFSQLFTLILFFFLSLLHSFTISSFLPSYNFNLASPASVFTSWVPPINTRPNTRPCRTPKHQRKAFPSFDIDAAAAKITSSHRRLGQTALIGLGVPHLLLGFLGRPADQ